MTQILQSVEKPSQWLLAQMILTTRDTDCQSREGRTGSNDLLLCLQSTGHIIVCSRIFFFEMLTTLLKCSWHKITTVYKDFALCVMRVIDANLLCRCSLGLSSNLPFPFRGGSKIAWWTKEQLHGRLNGCLLTSLPLLDFQIFHHPCLRHH